MDPVVLALDPQGSLIHVQGGLGEERLDGGALPLGQGVMQLQDPLQQGRFGDDLLDEGGQRVLHPLQCHHLRDQQVQDEGLDPGAVLAAGRTDPPGSCLGSAPGSGGRT